MRFVKSQKISKANDLILISSKKRTKSFPDSALATMYGRAELFSSFFGRCGIKVIWFWDFLTFSDFHKHLFLYHISGSKFQTIRYDFKPASVDKRSKGKVEICEGNSLSVTVPHSNGTTETNYK